MPDLDTLREKLCENLCRDVAVDQHPDGHLLVRTHFRFPDGDHYPIYLSELPFGGLRLSDTGHTLMRISYDHDVDSFLDGTRGMLLERTMGESGLKWDGGVFYLDTTLGHLPEAVFRFGQSLTRDLRLDFPVAIQRLRKLGRSLEPSRPRPPQVLASSTGVSDGEGVGAGTVVVAGYLDVVGVSAGCGPIEPGGG